jgi:tetratricopeptide (TPR) repeat protein
VKKFHKVTILGILLGFGGCLFGCEAFYRQVPQEEQTIDPEAQAREAAEIEARLSTCREYFEEGQLDKVRAVLVEVLERRQDHPQALYYWEKLNTDLYATVYPGHTLSGIAAYYYDDAEKWTVLAGANGIRSPETLSPYQRLRVPWLPACGEDKNEAGRLGTTMFGSPRPTKIVLHPVQEGDSLAALAKQHYGDKSLRYFLADYNRIAAPRSLKSVSSLKIPVFPERKKDTTKKDRETLRRGNLALKNKDYEKACRYFSSVPRSSPYRKEARSAMGRCKAEGASHYERLGDEALQNSEPKEACLYWKTALRLDPGRQEVEKKLEEAEDLVEALDLLPTLP